MVVDTSAIVAILLDEVDGPSLIRKLIEAGGAVLSAASYVEVRVVARSRGDQGEAEVEGTLLDCGIDVVPVTLAQARLAADAFARYGKGRHAAGLTLGDCFAYALAKERREPLLFKGGDFALTDVAAA